MHATHRGRGWVTAWGPAVLWAGALFLLSASPDLPGGGFLSRFRGADKLVHVVLYAVLGLCLAWGLRRHRGDAAGPPPLPLHAALVLLGALYAASDEWHQSFVPGRDASAVDWVADLCGVTWGYWVGSARRVDPARANETATPETG